MNNSTDRIRKLLDLYYRGETSPAQTDMLKRYFAGDENIPEDLIADACIFRAMTVGEPPVPRNLEQRIRDATLHASRSRRKRMPRLWLMVSAAASVCLIVSVALALLLSPPAPRRDIADTTTQEPCKEVSREAAPRHDGEHACKPFQQPKAAMKSTPATPPSKRLSVKMVAERKPSQQTETGNVVAGNYREVTDTAEAIAITMRLIATIDDSFSHTGAGIERIESAASVLRDPLNAGKSK